MRPGRWPLPAIFIFWSIPILLATTQHVAVAVLYGRSQWPEALLRTAPGWLLWAIFSIVVLHLGERYPPTRVEWRRPLVRHAPVALAMALAHIGVLTAANRVGSPQAARISWPEQYLAYLSGVLHVDLLIYAAILGVAHVTEMARVSEARDARLRAQLAESELRALRMQLDPHFLFNVLNTAVALMRIGETRKAADVLTALGDLLRRALQRDPPPFTTVAAELRFVEEYLRLERIRFEDRLQVSVLAQSETLDALVPSMILQPLVENAVRHGIANRPAGGAIEIRAARESDGLVLSVEDIGGGPRMEDNASGTGLGLANTRARLMAIYGSRAALKLELGDQGSRAQLTLPLATSKGEARG